jgi:predicted PurR-regulated permease PerM
MAHPVKDQMKYWGIATAIFMLAMWYLGDVILPFVLGGAIAYFLDPVADKLENLGCSRALATTIITLVAVVIFVLMILLVVPTLINQAIALFEVAPQLFQDLQAFLAERFPQALDEGSTLRQSLLSIGETIRAKGGELLSSVLSSASSIINIVVLFLIASTRCFHAIMHRLCANWPPRLIKLSRPSFAEWARFA